MQDTEIWKDIPNYEGRYQASNLGQIRSLNLSQELVLKQFVAPNGYLTIRLFKNKGKTFSVHQIIAVVFLGHNPCGYKLVVNHKDHNRLNNRVDNLEIISTRENTNQKHLKSTSRFTGVHWKKSRNKWRAQIKINGKSKTLGHFATEIEASEAYQKHLAKHLKSIS